MVEGSQPWRAAHNCCYKRHVAVSSTTGVAELQTGGTRANSRSAWVFLGFAIAPKIYTVISQYFNGGDRQQIPLLSLCPLH